MSAVFSRSLFLPSSVAHLFCNLLIFLYLKEGKMQYWWKNLFWPCISISDGLFEYQRIVFIILWIIIRTGTEIILHSWKLLCKIHAWCLFNKQQQNHLNKWSNRLLGAWIFFLKVELVLTYWFWRHYNKELVKEILLLLFSDNA